MSTRPGRGSARLRLLGALVLAGVVGAALASAPWLPTRPSRIVLIVVDTLRQDHVSAYGAAVSTPNIDRLAARGQLFTNAVSSFHQTTMSMAALFTARTPSIESPERTRPLHWNGRTWCGLARLAAPHTDAACVPPGLTTLAERLRHAGYRTIGVASNELLFQPAGFDRGFDEWIEVGGLSDAADPGAPHADGGRPEHARAARHVNRAVGEVLEARSPGALFLYVHYMDAHDWDLHGSYARAVEVMDAGVGRLLDELEARGLLADAVVVLTADHGESLGERHPLPERIGHHGNPSFEPVLRVPLIVSPAVLENTTRLVRSEDVMRLVLEIAAVDDRPTSDLDPDELYLSEESYQTYRRGRWKSVVSRRSQRFLLFDLDADPGETRDVALQHPTVAREHMRRIATLAAQLAATAEPPAVLSPTDIQRLRHLGYLE